MKFLSALLLCFAIAAARVSPDANPRAFNNYVSLWDHFWTQYANFVGSTYLGTALKESYEAYQTLYGDRKDFAKTDRRSR